MTTTQQIAILSKDCRWHDLLCHLQKCRVQVDKDFHFLEKLNIMNLAINYTTRNKIKESSKFHPKDVYIIQNIRVTYIGTIVPCCLTLL